MTDMVQFMSSVFINFLSLWDSGIVLLFTSFRQTLPILNSAGLVQLILLEMGEKLTNDITCPL